MQVFRNLHGFMMKFIEVKVSTVSGLEEQGIIITNLPFSFYGDFSFIFYWL